MQCESVQMLQQRLACLGAESPGSTAAPNRSYHDEPTVTPRCVPGCGSSRVSSGAGATSGSAGRPRHLHGRLDGPRQHDSHGELTDEPGSG